MRLRYFLPTLAYCAAIFWMSSQSESPFPGFLPNIWFPGADKVAHIVLYAGLAGTVTYGIRRQSPQPPARIQFLVPIVFALLYGLSDEVHQLFVPARTCSLGDLAADVAGAAAMQVLLRTRLWRPRPSIHGKQV